MTVRAHCVAFTLAFFRVCRKARTLWMCCFLCTLFSMQSFAQSDWTLLKSERGVEVYYKVTDCEDPIDPTIVPAPAFVPQKMELKIVNQNASSVEVDFFKDIKLSGNSSQQTVTANPGETLISDCANAPKVLLTEAEGDDRPVAMSDYVQAFQLTIKP